MYIEFVIADNFLLTFLAGTAGYALCHIKPKRWRVIVASIVGTVVAVFYPYMRLNLWSELAVKLALWVVLSVIMYIKMPRAIICALLFLGCTFTFGGASFAVGLIIYGSSSAAAEFSRRVPLFLTLGAAGVVYACLKFCIKRMRVPRARAPYEYGIDVEVFGSRMSFSAFLDTGNCVFDRVSGMPVVITDVDSFTDKLSGAAAVEFARRVIKLRRIRAKTHAGEAEIILVEPTRITVYSDRRGHTINAMVGLVCGHGKSFSATHEMLLNPAAMPSE